MDPNACLRDLRKLAQAMAEGNDTTFVLYGGAEAMAELVLALDMWLRLGGVLPEAWAGNRGGGA